MYCSLCHDNERPSSNSELKPYARDNVRAYYHCDNCDLVSAANDSLLSPEQEKLQYDQHRNNPDDLGYRTFLSRTLEPLLERVNLEAKGLDFGCGPGPTISVMAKEAGIEVSNYDPYYYPAPELLTKRYDFVTMTEVIEHIKQPMSALLLLDSLLKPKATLAIMTKRVIGQAEFEHWHYKNDPTHIRFYSIKTFSWITERLNWQLEVINKDVVFFTKV